MDLCKLGCLETICDLLNDINPKIILITLDILFNFLKNGHSYVNGMDDDDNFYALKLEALGAINRIEQLQDFPNDLVYTKTLHLLETFFITEKIE